MSAGNLFNTRQSAFGLRRKVVNSAYTVRVGGDERNFETDRVVAIVDPTDNFTIDVPAGDYLGQELLITLVAQATASVTITIDLATGTDIDLGDVGDYVSLEWVNEDAGWVVLASKTD